MHSTYFVVDFSYNPGSKNPLSIFELGDAFSSGWTSGRVGPRKMAPYDYFMEDLCQQYPGALLVQVRPTGLDIIDLTSKISFSTYDIQHLFDGSFGYVAHSYEIMTDLISQIIKCGDKRSKDSRSLLIYASSHPYIFTRLPHDLIKKNAFTSLKFVNLFSNTLSHALHNKGFFHEFAQGSPAYPKTFCLSTFCGTEAELLDFMKKSNADYYVIKPSNGTRSEGVHVISKRDLQKTVRGISNKDLFPVLHASYDGSGILIQACRLSRPVTFKGQDYYAKGRAVIRVDFIDSNAAPTLHFLTGYWQIASAPCKNGINDATTIAYGAANREGVLNIEKNEWDGFFRVETKKFVIDMMGLDQSFKKELKSDNQALDIFVSNSTAVLYGNKQNPLDHTYNAYRFQADIKTIFLYFLITFTLQALFQREISTKNLSLSLLFSALMTYLSRVIFRIETPVEPSSLMSKTSEQIGNTHDKQISTIEFKKGEHNAHKMRKGLSHHVSTGGSSVYKVPRFSGKVENDNGEHKSAIPPASDHDQRFRK